MEKVKITKETDEVVEVELEDLPQDIQQGYKEHGNTDNSSTLTIIQSEEI
jgi:hypothetical protein